MNEIIEIMARGRGRGRGRGGRGVNNNVNNITDKETQEPPAKKQYTTRSDDLQVAQATLDEKEDLSNI